ncbi:hypothetical protein EV2_023678 [Malus domestica]
MLRGIIFTSLTVPQVDVVDKEEAQDDEDEYSRARLGKQSGRGSRQLAPDRKIDTKCWLIALLLLVGKQRQGEGHGESMI